MTEGARPARKLPVNLAGAGTAGPLGARVSSQSSPQPVSGAPTNYGAQAKVDRCDVAKTKRVQPPTTADLIASVQAAALASSESPLVSRRAPRALIPSGPFPSSQAASDALKDGLASLKQALKARNGGVDVAINFDPVAFPEGTQEATEAKLEQLRILAAAVNSPANNDRWKGISGVYVNKGLWSASAYVNRGTLCVNAPAWANNKPAADDRQSQLNAIEGALKRA